MTDSAEPQAPPLTELLQAELRGPLARHKGWLLLLLLIAAAAAAWTVRRSAQPVEAPRYATEAAKLGALVVKVSATGNLQPTNQVEVGSELSGIVTAVLVDDNDRVHTGQVLARLDLSRLKDAVARSRASLEAAQAQVLQAEATVAESASELQRFRQVAEASGGKVPSKRELDAADAALKRAQANEAIARASVAQALAALQSDQTNLAKASIRSPIDGVVLTRSVEPGQTVAASLQAPVLFTLAEDLTKMELQVDVDEADVGQVAVGQEASFSVDAWPGRRYAAVITRVGFGSQLVDGVVSYPTLLRVDNADLSLRPGMTGTAEIVTLVREGALLVPSAALRFDPAAEDEAPSGRSGGVLGRLFIRPPRSTPQRRPTIAAGAQRLWVLQAGEPDPVTVQVGASDGQWSEIIGGELEPGAPVITERLGAAP